MTTIELYLVRPVLMTMTFQGVKEMKLMNSYLIKCNLYVTVTSMSTIVDMTDLCPVNHLKCCIC